jgi:hypothetical protein
VLVSGKTGGNVFDIVILIVIVTVVVQRNHPLRLVHSDSPSSPHTGQTELLFSPISGRQCSRAVQPGKEGRSIALF